MMNRGEWTTCGNYNAGDITTWKGKVYKALQQSAGREPDKNPTYWEYLGLFPGVVPPHDGLEGLHGTSETEFYHLNEDQAAAMLYADEPSAANPVLTKKNMPALGKSIEEFEALPMPTGMGIIYGAYFDELEQKLIVA
jgi:hypothetical protein